MIFIMNQKFFEKNIEKIAKKSDYFILDGENFGVTGRRANQESDAIASKYSKSHSVGSFTPEARLYSMLKKKKKGDEVNEIKLKNEVDAYLHDKALISVINVAFKAQVVEGIESDLHILIVLPNIAYKYLGEILAKRMEKLAKLDFDFIYTQDDIKENKKLLKKKLKPNQLRAINKASQQIEKKYKLKFSDSKD